VQNGGGGGPIVGHAGIGSGLRSAGSVGNRRRTKGKAGKVLRVPPSLSEASSATLLQVPPSAIKVARIAARSSRSGAKERASARRGTAARAECKHGGRSSPRDTSGLWLETKVGGNGPRSDGCLHHAVAERVVVLPISECLLAALLLEDLSQVPGHVRKIHVLKESNLHCSFYQLG
jgi:hypothetical protein